MIKIDKSEFDRFSVKVTNKAKDTQSISNAIRKSTLSIEARAKNNLTNNKSVKTGHLRRSIAHKISLFEGVVHTSNVKYALSVEKGSRPHIIKAKNRKALYWKGASHPVKQVKHPGGKAKPFLKPAFEAEKPKFIQNLKEAIKLD